ncbi:aminotransferase class III-fold pyridoxal phosphate-dependent enzyme [Candidatus Poribacteria bacterium]|nr:aminotransferase class III-fold pyridoxal phosphate-dependent enzyme [Candidatus Poribacteria bacterium]
MNSTSGGRCVEESWKLYDQAVKVIPMATQTHSKAPREKLRGVEPCFIVRGEGCRVWDLDGNEYIDLRNALGPVTLGYRFPAVDEAIRRQLESGVLFSYPHPLEVEVAERLVKLIPCAERVRFLKTGGEAMAATHRLARAFTGRDLILTCGYHGWVNTTSRPGVPEPIRSTYRALPWGDATPYVEAFKASPKGIAAVSVACNYADIERGHIFLADLRELTERYGALLIFDEIVTGFRLSVGGAQEYFGVTPDLAVFSKGIANGVPLSCYVGRAEVMERVKEVVISSTFGGDTLGLAAARAVLDVYEREDVIGTFWKRGRQLHEGFNERCRRLGVPVGFRGLPPTGQLVFEHPDAGRNGDLFLRFNAEVLKRGVIIYTVCYPNYSHTEADIDEAVEVMGEALEVMKTEGLFD